MNKLRQQMNSPRFLFLSGVLTGFALIIVFHTLAALNVIHPH